MSLGWMEIRDPHAYPAKGRPKIVAAPRWPVFEPPRLSRERRRFVNETARGVAGMTD